MTLGMNAAWRAKQAKQKLCQRCGLFYDKSLPQCCHCGHLNDAELLQLKHRHKLARIKAARIGQILIFLAVLIGLVLLLSFL